MCDEEIRKVIKRAIEDVNEILDKYGAEKIHDTTQDFLITTLVKG